MKRRRFINLIILFFIFFSNPLKVFGTINSIQLGKQAPNFLLNGYSKTTPNKQKWSLDDFNGKWLILYFYPMDFSSGCTLEAKGFQNNLDKYKQYNSSIVGISTDNQEKHSSFCSSSEISYTLLSDESGEISKLYDSWLDPYSKRNTFLINPDGIVVYKWIGARPIGHALEVLEVLIKKQKIYA